MPESLRALDGSYLEVPLVQTTSAATGHVINEQQARELTLPTRNFQQILTLSPGTVASLSNNSEMGRGDVNIHGRQPLHLS